MLFGQNDDKEKNDFFENDGGMEETPKPPKKPNYKPDDPDYWEEDSEWDHLHNGSRWTFWLWIAGAAVVIGLIIGCWLRYFSPYVEDATQYGYIEHIEKRGTVFKTYEGVMIPYKDLMDTTRIYNRDFVFSVDNDKAAAMLKRAQLSAKPVRVGYKIYHATLPWRGAAKIVVTEADTIDPKKILPPEFAPKLR